ncbi:MAG: GNAT family N-acetyltransferase [Planctomycetes bacterium]|nr:GNAT family N-acetyltransferase [Planctomycetota bacterium]
MSQVRLRAVEPDDLPLFFEHQRDPVAAKLAGFESRDREAFDQHWQRVQSDEANVTRTVVLRDVVVGSIGSWEQNGRTLVGYWVDRAYWGRGVATAALTLLLAELARRPLCAYVAAHNAASVRVLTKCGFRLDPGGEADPDELLLVLR